MQSFQVRLPKKGCDANTIIKRIEEVHEFCESLNSKILKEEITEKRIQKQFLDKMQSKNEETMMNRENKNGLVFQGSCPNLHNMKQHESISRLEYKRKRDTTMNNDVDTTCRYEEKMKMKTMEEFNQSTKSNGITFRCCDAYENSTLPLVIATTGGRFRAWNEKFLAECNLPSSGHYDSLTLFDIVMPDALFLLHEIFLTSLFEEPPLTIDSDKSTPSETGHRCTSLHNNYSLALTVPCIEFEKGQNKRYITISLIEQDPNRCFRCIISTKPEKAIGKVYKICQGKLFGKS